MQRRWLLCFLSVIIVLGTITIGLYTRTQPHGGWDAWAIWNMHARVLYRTDDWRTLFQLAPLTHPDYPLLLPALVTVLWTLIGRETLIVPVAVSVAFTIGTGGLLFLAVRVARDTRQAMLATLLLIGTSTFLSTGATQYADIPFGAFVLATLALLTLSTRHSSRRWLPGVAGMLAGCAVWTKNEGLLFIGIVVVVILSFWMLGQMNANKIVYFVVGVAPFLVSIAYIRWFLAPSNDLFTTSSSGSSLTKLLDPARYVLLAKLLIVWLPRFGRGVLALLVVYAVLVGRTPHARRADVLPLLVSGLMFAGYVVVYLTTPYDVAWHVETSLLRLLLQLWPSILFGVFLIIRNPLEPPVVPASTLQEIV